MQGETHPSSYSEFWFLESKQSLNLLAKQKTIHLVCEEGIFTFSCQCFLACLGSARWGPWCLLFHILSTKEILKIPS